MSASTKIEWTDATWNPVTGCTEVSPGCDHCYAKTFAERWRGTPGHHFERGFDVVLRPERLDQPLRWRKPKRVFVNSMSDLFHDAIPDEFIAQVFAVMSIAKQHTFQVLTKRHGRMRSLLSHPLFKLMVNAERLKRGVSVLPDSRRADGSYAWPLSNVWLGVSVENQQWADIRIPALLGTPAAVRFLSMEPLLGPVTLHEYRTQPADPTVDWVIVGGESGPGARPVHPDWVHSLRDQCTAAGVPFHFKQWGAWAPRGRLVDGVPLPVDNASTGILNVEGNLRGRAFGSLTNALCTFSDGSHCHVVERVGKKAAGRELDGRTWDEFPREERS